jgi:hypothetical protein
MGVGVLNLKKVAGGLAILGGSEPVAGKKRGWGGLVFKSASSNMQNSMYVVVGNNMPPLGGRG